MASSDPSNIESNHSSSEEEEVAIARRTSVRSPSKAQCELVGTRRSRRNPSNIESNPPPSGEEEVVIARRTSVRSPCKAQWELVSSRRSRRRPANSTLPSTSNATASRALNLNSREEFPALQLSGSPSSSSSGDPFAKVVTAAIR